MLHRFGIRLILCLLLGSFPAWAQTANLTPLYSFDGAANGGSPAGLILGSDNNFYGVTQFGGTTGNGTLYRSSQAGQLTTLFSSFPAGEFANPVGLIQAPDGSFYGVTQGLNNATGANGGLFRYVPSTGTFTALQSFTNSGNNGKLPNPDLALDSAGNIYGTTSTGTLSDFNGTVFRYTPSTGTFTTLYRFTGGADGSNPRTGLVLASDGNLYGTTFAGGNIAAGSNGTVFRLNPTTGALTTIFTFPGGRNGAGPSATPIQATDGFLYGPTSAGGNPGGIFAGSGLGLIYRISTGGTSYGVIYRFTGGNDGALPNTRLVQSTAPGPTLGQVYGTNVLFAGNCANGVVYKIPTFNQESTLHCFTGGNDGFYPASNLLQGSDRSFYGTTSNGGVNGSGVLYRVVDPNTPNPIITSIAPTTPVAAGTQLTITGLNLSLVNQVLFTGIDGSSLIVPATAFTVVSDTQVNVTVPLGAATGLIQVNAPSGSGSSPLPVTITPSILSFSPTRGPVGTQVVLLGSGLTGPISAQFNGLNTFTPPVIYNDFSNPFPGGVSAIVPFGATSGPISLTVAGGTVTTTTSFTVGTIGPRLLSLDSLAAPVGTFLTLTGTGFTGTTAVTFYNGVPATFTVVSDTTITTTVPVGAVTGPITLTNPNGTASSLSFFQVTAPVPTITSFTPSQGPIGSTTTITGTGFTGTNAVRIGNIVGAFTVNSNTSLTFTIPAGAVTAPISVTTPGGTVTSTTNFTVGAATPTFSPPRANFGAAIVLANGNFTGATSVTFNGLPATFTVNSATQITAIVPPGATSGNIVVTAPGGNTILTGFVVNPVAIRTLGWQQSGTGDFNGDGRPDLLWRNYTTGVNRVWFMSGTTFLSQVDLISQTDPNWQLVGAADFTADGKPDLVWRNFITGQNAVWQMNGTTFIQSLPLQSVTDPNFQLAGLGDLTGDGKPDLIWRNSGTGFVGAGDVYLWQMNGTTFVNAFLIGPVADPYWQMAGVGDFTNDGNPDLIWRYWGPTGDFATQVYLWQMNGFTYQQAFLIGPVTLDFQLTGVGEFTGDSQLDLFWSNNVTGQNFVWRMSGYTYQEAFFIGPTPTN